MAPTNQQLADLLAQMIETTAGHTAAFIKATQEQAAAFAGAVDRLIENDNRHHDQFRKRMEDLALAQGVIKAETARNSEHREKVVKYLIAVVIVPIGVGIVSMVMNGR